MKGPINHFSYSQLNTYLMCPLRYRLKYVEVIPPAFTTSALVFGGCIHEAAEAFHQQRLIGEELRPDQMLDVYRQAWADRDEVELRFCNGDSEESLMEKAAQMLTLYHEGFDPEAEIVGIEEFFEVQLDDSVPPFQGYIDLIEQSAGGTVTIVDLKNLSRKTSRSQVNQNLQLTAYSIGAESLGFDPEKLKLRFDVLTKTKTPELQKIETSRSSEQRQRFVKLVERVWNAIEREVWFPRQDWHCRQCAWSDPCAKW